MCDSAPRLGRPAARTVYYCTGEPGIVTDLPMREYRRGVMLESPSNAGSSPRLLAQTM
jgi:hypothetical protein